MVFLHTKKYPFGYIFEGLGMENVDMFYGPFIYEFYGHLVYIHT
jgi:hypothetical protein